MATYIQRAQALIEAARNGVPTAEQQQRVAAAFEAYAPDIVAVIKAARPWVDSGQVDENSNPILIPDDSALTNAEKAEVFVRAYIRWARSVVGVVAEKDAKDSYDATVKAAKDAAEGDVGTEPEPPPYEPPAPAPLSEAAPAPKPAPAPQKEPVAEPVAEPVKKKGWWARLWARFLEWDRL